MTTEATCCPSLLLGRALVGEDLRRFRSKRHGSLQQCHLGELVQVWEIRSGSSYLSQNDLRAHFGVGAREKVDKIEILWPDGTRQTLLNVKVNQILEVLKPTGPNGK